MDIISIEPSSSTSSGQGDPNTASDALGPQTYNLLKQVIQGIHNELNNPEKTYPIGEYAQRASRLTGFPATAFKSICSKLTICSNYLCGKELKRKTVHYALMSFCIKHTKYPDCFELLMEICDDLQLINDMQSFIRNLTDMGYVLRRRPQGKIPYVVEKPEVAFERFLYLKKITEYRSEKRRIYYIGEASLSREGDVLNFEETIAYRKNSTKPLLKFLYIVSNEVEGVIYSFRAIEKFNAKHFMKWIRNDILTKTILSDNCIIVLDNSEHHNDKVCSSLTSLDKSLKSEIKEWLECHRIPFTDDMSKRQLWKLAEKCTDIHENVYIIDRIIKENGHSVLRLPNCINELSLATGVRHLIKAGLTKDIHTMETLQVFLESIKNAINLNKLNGYNSSLIDEEKKILNLDIKFEIIRDLLEAPVCRLLQKEDDNNFDMEFPFFMD